MGKITAISITSNSHSEEESSVERKPDRISQLPDDILSSIISYFIVRDVVRASLLSKRWRHITSIKYNLNFDWNSMFPKIREWFPGSRYRRDRNIDVVAYRDGFVGGVNQFLQHYNCSQSQLVSFRVSFHLDRDSSYDIDRWVSFASSMGVQQLELLLTRTTFCSLAINIEIMNFYTLRSELFSQINVSKLQHVFLRSCILGTGVINQFNCVKSLILADVRLGPLGAETIVSCCLKLESMTLANCALPLKLFISGSLHSLKVFSVLDCSGVEHIELCAANLTSFEFAGTMIKFSFSSVPDLEKVFFRTKLQNGVQHVFSEIAKDFPLVKILSVSTKHIWVHCPVEHMNTFSKVKKLELFVMPRWDGKFDTLKMISVLKTCPLLEKFYLVSFPGNPERLPRNLQGIRVLTDCVHKHLKEIHCGGAFDLGYMEFVLNVLEYAATLQLMVIDPNMKTYYGGGHWRNYHRRMKEWEREAITARLHDYSRRLTVIVK